MGPNWVLSAPDGPHVGPMKLAIRVDGLYVWDHVVEGLLISQVYTFPEFHVCFSYIYIYHHCSLFDYLDPTVRLHVIIILLHVYLMLFLSDCGSCRYCSVVVGCARRWVDFIWSYPYWACNLNGTKYGFYATIYHDLSCRMSGNGDYNWMLCLTYWLCFIRFIVFYGTILLSFNVTDIWVWIDPFMLIKLLLLLLYIIVISL